MSKGSRTAKNGFSNEVDVVNKFNNWQNDDDAKQWLVTMQYDLNKIEYVRAIKLAGYKTDVQVQVTIKMKALIDAQNLQVKLVSQLNGFNQIDKRWIDVYGKMWNIPDFVLLTLRRYTGEISPVIPTRDSRRMFMDEFDEHEQMQLVDWLSENKYLIICDIMKGRGHFAAEWVLVGQKLQDATRYALVPMNLAMNHFSKGNVEVTPQGNVKIGRITMQRKGGDGGKETAKMLQFKLNPAELFELTID